MSEQDLAKLLYLASAVLFILGMKRMTRVRSARAGNAMSAAAMLLAVVGALLEYNIVSTQFLIIGLVLTGTIIFNKEA